MNTYDVKAFGAVGDGIANDTSAIQAAIDGCAGTGGKVVVPAGVYRTGTLVLRSNVHFHVSAGATIQGSHDIRDYRDDVDRFVDGVGRKRGLCLIFVGEATGVTIDGEGTFDGQGAMFHKDQGYQGERPFLLRMLKSADVKLHGVTLRDSGAWVTHVQQCRDIEIKGIVIRSRVNSNNDGLDIDGCSRVTIEDCDIDAGDDAICLKSTSSSACEDIQVRGCKLRSRHAGIKFGTESMGGFRRVRISDCTIYDTNGGGIKLMTVDGAVLEDVNISNITMEDVTGPIFLRLGSRMQTFRQGQEPGEVGALRNVTFTDIKAKVKEGKNRNAVIVTGIPGHAVHNIAFERMDILFPGGHQDELPDYRDIPELEREYPEYYKFGILPGYAFFIRHATDIRLNDITVGTVRSDRRPAVVAVDVTGLQMKEVRERNGQ